MLKTATKYFVLICFLLSTGIKTSPAQSALSAEEIEQYSNDAEKLVSFLEYTFNTIGSPEISTKEKDIIINQSFSKFFESNKVQIEDDLDENRETPINKEVQAYLKDIDFFFETVAFKFDIEQIEHQVNEKNQLFFKVTFNRNLQGITITGDTVNSNRIRYIEINLNDSEKDLKIASIYTTKLNEKEELRRWWAELPPVWKDLFGDNIFLYDTVRMNDIVWYNDSIAKLNFMVKWRMSRDTLSFESQDSLFVSLSDTSSMLSLALLDKQLKKLTELDTLNVSGTSQIVSLEPLLKLSGLKRIDCSHTLIDDLTPLRNLTHLEYINCSHTAVETLEPLKYSTKLEVVDISHTLVYSLDPVVNFTQLKKLFFNHTSIDSIQVLATLEKLKTLEFAASQVRSLEPLSEMISLERLDFSETQIDDVSALSALKNIYFLKFEKTPVKNLQPLKDLSSLHFLFADNSQISDISPLNGLPELNKIYCDQTHVTTQEALSFMALNPDVLVIYESATLIDWWKDLSPAWKEVFIEKVSWMRNPKKEELHQITRIDAINISGNKRIQTLEPLSQLSLLKEINCQGTNISDLEPLEALADLRELNFSGTDVQDVKALEKLSKLEILWFDQTRVSSIYPLLNLSEIRYMYCDRSPVSVDEIVDFMRLHPESLVIYQSEKLERWWDQLPDVWKLLAEKFLKTTEDLTREQLQGIANLRRINLGDFPEMERRSIEIKSLDHIQKLIFLEELYFTNTSITSLEPLAGMETMKVLVCPNNPIETLEPLTQVRNLEHLDIQNTPVESIEFLAALKALKKLNISGTQIKNLKGLEQLINLEQLDCFNTGIKNIKEVQQRPNLKLIRCYNTRLSQKKVDNFKKANPGVEIVFY
jgi:hypothetical protein